MSEPINILFTIPNFITAGSGRALVNIVERLDRSKFTPAICVSRKGGPLGEEIEKMEIPYLEAPFTVPAIPRLAMFRRAREAAAVFRPYRFQLWHSFHYADDYSEPLIAHYAGVRAWIYTKKNMSWNSRAWYLRTMFANRIAAQNSDMMNNFFGNLLFRRKATLIPRGVDSDLFHPDVERRLGIRSALGIPSNAIVAGCVAQLVPVKDHPMLIRAVAEVPEMFLLMAGAPLDAAYADSLGQLVSELGLARRVHFLGRVQDTPALLAELDIFVLSTRGGGRGEGCPVALLEAMSAGKACLATDVPGSRDVLYGNDGGWLVPSADHKEMAQALRKLAGTPDLRMNLGKEARQRILERYTIEREVQQHVALYESIVPGNGHKS